MKFRKILSIVLCLILASAIASPAFAILIASKDTDYAITNPYANINWETVNQYKTSLHNHTNMSDGDPTLKQSVERHVETGYDIVSISDHGTSSISWTETQKGNIIHGVLSLVGKSEGELEYLGTEGTFNNGMTYTATVENGNDYLNVNDKKIMRMPYSIENGAVSVNAHVNSWFAPYEDNSICDYERTVKGVQKAGAVCVINHPGEYTKAKSDLTSEEAYNEENPVYEYYINKFYGLIDKYDCCIGLDMNSKGDSRTRYDRELWDILLQRRTAKGKNVYAIASSDAHQLNKIDTGFVYLLMDDLTADAARKSMVNGEFFAASHCNGNYLELMNIQENLKKYYGETDLYGKIKNITDLMAKRVADVASGEEKPGSSLGYEFNCLDENGYCSAETQPMITAIAVDDDEDTITISAENALLVRFIADGEVVAVLPASQGTASIDLDDYSDKLGTYIRAEVFGEGGTVYTQAFMLDYDGAPEYHEYPYFNIPTLDFLFAEIRTLIVKIERTFANLSK